MDWHRLWVNAELTYRYYILRAPRMNLGAEYVAFCRRRMERARVKQLTARSVEDR